MHKSRAAVKSAITRGKGFLFSDPQLTVFFFPTSLLCLIFWDWFDVLVPRTYRKTVCKFTYKIHVSTEFETFKLDHKEKWSIRCCCTALAHLKTKITIYVHMSMFGVFIHYLLSRDSIHISTYLSWSSSLNQKYGVLLTAGIKASYGNWQGQNRQSAACMQLNHLSALTCWTRTHRMTFVYSSEGCVGMYLKYFSSSIFAFEYTQFVQLYLRFGTCRVCVHMLLYISCVHVCVFVSSRRCISGLKGLPSETS